MTRVPRRHARTDHPADRGDRGVAVVEFAVVTLPLLLLITAIVQVGLAYSAQLTFENAARRGVRLGAVCAANCSPTADAATRNALPSSYRSDSNLVVAEQRCTSSGSCAASPSYCTTTDTAQTAYEQVTVQAPYEFTFGFFDAKQAPFSVTVTGRASMPCGG